MGYNNVDVMVSGPNKPSSTYKTKILKGNQSFASQVTEANMKYVIKYDFDLRGGEVTIPKNCILEFDGGSLSSGTLVLDDTKLEGNILFDGVELGGIIVNKNIHINWFKDSDDDALYFCGLIATPDKTIYVDRDIEIHNSRIISINSNVDLCGNTILFNSGTGRSSEIHIVSGISPYTISDSQSIQYLLGIINGTNSRQLDSNAPSSIANLKNVLVKIEAEHVNVNIETVRTLNSETFYYSELMYIDNNGYVNGHFWNNSLGNGNVTVTVYNASSDLIKIGNGTLKFVSEYTGNQTSYMGFITRRSNVIFEKITIDRSDVPNLISQGVFYLNQCYNIICRDIFVINKSSVVYSYIIYALNCFDIIIENFNSQEFVNNVWGEMAMSYVENVHILNSKMSRVDSHYRMHDLSIDNCTIGSWGLNYHGSGSIYVNNTSFYSSYLLKPRADYDGCFRGNVYLTDISWYLTKNKLDGNTIGSRCPMILLQMTSNHDYHPNDSNYEYNVAGKNIYFKNINIVNYERNEVLQPRLVFSAYADNTKLVSLIFPNIYVDTLKNYSGQDFKTLSAARFIDYFRYTQLTSSNYSSGHNYVGNATIEIRNVDFPLPDVPRYVYMEDIVTNTLTDDVYSREDINNCLLPNYRYINCKNVGLGGVFKHEVIEIFDSTISSTGANISNTWYSIPCLYAYNSTFIADNKNNTGKAPDFKLVTEGVIESCSFDVDDYMTTLGPTNFCSCIINSYMTDYTSQTPMFMKISNVITKNCYIGDRLARSWENVRTKLASYGSVATFLEVVQYFVGQTSYLRTAKSSLVLGSRMKGLCVFDTSSEKPVWWNGTAWVDATGATV